MAKFTVLIPHAELEAARNKGHDLYALPKQRIRDKAIELGLMTEGELLLYPFELVMWSSQQYMVYEVTFLDA